MTTIKLRIKHPSGAEFEAEGPAELIISEKSAFLSTIAAIERQPAKPRQEDRQPERQTDDSGEAVDWAKAAENKETGLKLRLKHPEIKAKTAAMILIAANMQLNKTPEISAITLSKALKKSGYQPGRLDRLMGGAIKNNWVQASGTKRNRTYQATSRGLEIAWLEARKLTK